MRNKIKKYMENKYGVLQAQPDPIDGHFKFTTEDVDEIMKALGWENSRNPSLDHMDGYEGNDLDNDTSLENPDDEDKSCVKNYKMEDVDANGYNSDASLEEIFDKDCLRVKVSTEGGDHDKDDVKVDDYDDRLKEDEEDINVQKENSNDRAFDAVRDTDGSDATSEEVFDAHAPMRDNYHDSTGDSGLNMLPLQDGINSSIDVSKKCAYSECTKLVAPGRHKYCDAHWKEAQRDQQREWSAKRRRSSVEPNGEYIPHVTQKRSDGDNDCVDGDADANADADADADNYANSAQHSSESEMYTGKRKLETEDNTKDQVTSLHAEEGVQDAAGFQNTVDKNRICGYSGCTEMIAPRRHKYCEFHWMAARKDSQRIWINKYKKADPTSDLNTNEPTGVCVYNGCAETVAPGRYKYCELHWKEARKDSQRAWCAKVKAMHGENYENSRNIGKAMYTSNDASIDYSSMMNVDSNNFLAASPDATVSSALPQEPQENMRYVDLFTGMLYMHGNGSVPSHEIRHENT